MTRHCYTTRVAINAEHRPWLDVTRPVPERVAALMAQMTLEEKVGQTHQVANLHADDDAELLRQGRIGSSVFASGATGGNVRDEGVLAHNVDAAQRHAVEESRLGVPLLFGRDVIHGHRTVFPIPLGLAAGWDVDLAEQAGETAAYEAVVDGVAWTFAPMVDLSEEPRWGRVAESLGETPVLSGRLGAALSTPTLAFGADLVLVGAARIGDLAGDAGAGLGELLDAVLDAVLGEVAEVGAEGVGLDAVHADVEVGLVHGPDDVGPRDVEDLVAALVALEVVERGVLTLQHGAHRAVGHDDALGQRCPE